MDTNFATQLTLSILTFAPGVALLAGLAFVGLLMLIEKHVFVQQDLAIAAGPAVQLASSAVQNPGPGRIVDGLRAAVAAKDEASLKVAVGERK